jgi:hypothetical protein
VQSPTIVIHTSPTRKRGTSAPELSLALRARTLRMLASVTAGVLFLSAGAATVSAQFQAIRIVEGAAAEMAEEDEDEAAQAQQDFNRIELSENQLEMWVFRNSSNLETARTQALNGLEIQLEVISQVGELSEDQRKKLTLAGKGDIERFFAEFMVVRRAFKPGSMTQQEYSDLWSRIQPMVQRYASGLHHQGSLFSKTVRTTLSGEQLKKFDEMNRDRQRRHYRAKIEMTVNTLESRTPLTKEQRTKLIDMLLEKTQPPRAWGQSDFYLVLWRMSQLPEADLKALFDDREWKVIKAQIDQVAGMREWIKQQEGEGDDGVARRVLVE